MAVLEPYRSTSVLTRKNKSLHHEVQNRTEVYNATNCWDTLKHLQQPGLDEWGCALCQACSSRFVMSARDWKSTHDPPTPRWHGSHNTIFCLFACQQPPLSRLVQKSGLCRVSLVPVLQVAATRPPHWGGDLITNTSCSLPACFIICSTHSTEVATRTATFNPLMYEDQMLVLFSMWIRNPLRNPRRERCPVCRFDSKTKMGYWSLSLKSCLGHILFI